MSDSSFCSSSREEELLSVEGRASYVLVVVIVSVFPPYSVRRIVFRDLDFFCVLLGKKQYSLRIIEFFASRSGSLVICFFLHRVLKAEFVAEKATEKVLLDVRIVKKGEDIFQSFTSLRKGTKEIKTR